MASKISGKKIGVELNKLDYEQAIFLLRLLYSQKLKILQGFFDCKIMPRNETINHYYTTLTLVLTELLKRRDLKVFRESFPELYESLLGDMSALDESWEIVQGNAYDFLGKIEKEYIRLGKPVFPVINKIDAFIKNSDLALQVHIDYCNKLSDSLFNTSSKPEIYFDKNTGRGFVGNKPFTCRSKNRFFNLVLYLYENMNQTIPRSKVLEHIWNAKENDVASNKTNTGLINNAAKEIRKLIGVSKEFLISNSGSLTLQGKKLNAPPN